MRRFSVINAAVARRVQRSAHLPRGYLRGPNVAAMDRAFMRSAKGSAGSEGRTRLSKASLAEEGGRVEIGWLVTANEDAAVRTESEFLERYRDEHGQYPPVR